MEKSRGFSFNPKENYNSSNTLNPEQKELPKNNHEVVEQFKIAGLPLNNELQSMLNEAPEHQSNRKGSGLTQVGRHLAEYVRRKRDISKDLNVFDHEVKQKILEIEESSEQKTALKELIKRLETITLKMQFPESKIIADMIADIMEAREVNLDIPELPAAEEKNTIGTCTTAESYFFNFLRKFHILEKDFSSGKSKMNVIVDDSNRPLFLEKIGLGEDHSAMSLQTIYINQVEIPPGSLLAIQYNTKTIPKGRKLFLIEELLLNQKI